MRLRFIKLSNQNILQITFFLLLWACGLLSVAQGQKRERSGLKDANTSVLANGAWAKVSVSEDGIYKLTYQDFVNYGLTNAPVSSDKIGVFGQGAGTFEFSTAAAVSENIWENFIQISDGGDGLFGPGDYLLFYGAGPDYMKETVDGFEQERNVYDRTSYYFITSTNGSGKTIPNQEEITEEPIETIGYHQFISIYENDLNSPAKSGRRLYGESFEFVQSQQFQVQTRQPISGESGVLSVVTGIFPGATVATMRIDVAGQTQTISQNPVGLYTKAARRQVDFELNNSNGENVSVALNYSKPNDDSKAWLDYIKFTANTASLNASGKPYLLPAQGIQGGYNFYSSFINSNSEYWNVNRFGAFEKLDKKTNNNQLGLLLPAGIANRIVEVSGADYPAPSLVGTVANQNLHSIENVDYLIVYPQIFEGPANQLADFHRENGLEVRTVLIDQIYNEFSSGALHAVGVRNFFKHVYDKDPNKLKYALLFGDGSYINQAGFEGNSNFLPTYQSANSEVETTSFVCDDFFAFLGDNEGSSTDDQTSGRVNVIRSDVDIALGRFPVSTISQAQAMVNKVIRYMSGPKEEVFGDWRTNITFVTDDFDGNGAPSEPQHTRDANRLADWILDNYEPYEVEKVFADAYKQESTPGGSRYPAVNKIIKDRVQEGTFLMNYTGHGGEVGWAHERILDLSIINGWTNTYKMPVMVTATCEFSKFDDFERTSAGELCLLNPNGGAIGLLSTTRVVYSDANDRLNTDFFENLFVKENGENLRLGEIYMKTKQQYVASNPSSVNHLNFLLLGDPALKLAFPENKVSLTKINDQEIGQFSDTIKALSLVKLEGEISDAQGKMEGFNGVVDVKVMDKEVIQETLNNDGGTSKISFRTRNSKLYSGSVSVVNGSFTVQFIVPKDIQYEEGQGLFQFYAYSNETDASGANDSLLIGGVSNTPLADDRGPNIDLYLNNLDFVWGDITGENPNLIAFLSDESGLNTTGAGIGHDIIAFIDGDIQNAVTLNSFYRSDLDSYQSGSLEFPFEGIPSGDHMLTLRAWDNNNNPSDAQLNFMVRAAGEPFLEELMAYPNPAVDNSTIRFTHNQGGYAAEAVLEIIDMQGKVVAQEVWNMNAQEKGRAEYTWDLKNQGGSTINAGTYVYRVTINSASGESTRATNKLLVVR